MIFLGNMHKSNYLKLPSSMSYDGMDGLIDYYSHISEIDGVLSVDLSSVNVIDGVGLQWLIILKWVSLNKGVMVEFISHSIMLDKLFHLIDFVEKIHVSYIANDRSMAHTSAVSRPKQSETDELTRVDSIADDGKRHSYRIDIKPRFNSFREGINIVPVLHELQGLGECHISSFINRNFNESDFDMHGCYLEFSILITSSYTVDIIEEVFFFVLDQWDVYIAQIDS